MTQNQIIMLAILVVYLIINAGLGMIVSNRQDKKSTMNFEKKYNGLKKLFRIKNQSDRLHLN